MRNPRCEFVPGDRVRVVASRVPGDHGRWPDEPGTVIAPPVPSWEANPDAVWVVGDCGVVARAHCSWLLQIGDADDR